MWRRGAVTLLLACAFLWLAGGSASADFQCVQTQCEGDSRACVEAVSAISNACKMAANRTCNSVPVAERFKCLTGELRVCSDARHEQLSACRVEALTCYVSCGPAEGERADYWCVGETTSAFCETDPAAPDSVGSVCSRVLSGDGPAQSMSCEPLSHERIVRELGSGQ